MRRTRTEETSAARVRISAQETFLGQTFSTAVLMSFTTSKPLMELLFGRACCSLTIVAVLFNKIDASHPCMCHDHQQHTRFVSCSFLEISNVGFLHGFFNMKKKKSNLGRNLMGNY